MPELTPGLLAELEHTVTYADTASSWGSGGGVGVRDSMFEFGGKTGDKFVHKSSFIMLFPNYIRRFAV